MDSRFQYFNLYVYENSCRKTRQMDQFRTDVTSAERAANNASRELIKMLKQIHSTSTSVRSPTSLGDSCDAIAIARTLIIDRSIDRSIGGRTRNESGSYVESAMSNRERAISDQDYPELIEYTAVDQQLQ